MLQRRVSSVAERDIRSSVSVECTEDWTALDLLRNFRGSESEQRVSMTTQKWLLLGAMILGLLVVLYLVFFCPSDCH